MRMRKRFKCDSSLRVETWLVIYFMKDLLCVWSWEKLSLSVAVGFSL